MLLLQAIAGLGPPHLGPNVLGARESRQGAVLEQEPSIL